MLWSVSINSMHFDANKTTNNVTSVHDIVRTHLQRDVDVLFLVLHHGVEMRQRRHALGLQVVRRSQEVTQLLGR